MEINEIVHGFKLIRIKEIADINATLYEFIHLKSLGKVAYLKNDDQNCCFAIGFKTLPLDSSGVCHIIEHSVLCGSKKYPVKDPFISLVKSSLATFINAFTAYDWTMYPFASQTPKDFDNILQIYLDAVFNPLSMVDDKAFLQEGCHLELLNMDDEINYKGVVYNEMKGAMSSVDELLTQATLQVMYKDTPYRFNSGGDPKVIPSLTYQAYQDFYKSHYTPQNAFTFLYGDLNIEEKLAFIDQEYFSKFEAIENFNQNIEIQKPHIQLNYQEEYPIGKEEKTTDNTYMSLCYNLGEYNDVETFLAFNVLCDALLSNNNSILKKALLDAKLGQNVTCRIEDDNIMSALHIYLQKTNPNQKERFKEVFENAVLKLVQEGIDHKILLASINRLQFINQEADVGDMPKGLIYAMKMMGSFNYNGDLADHLMFNKHFEKFKAELDHRYFENLLEKYIINSQHHVEVVLIPSKTLFEKNQQELHDELVKIKNALSLKEKEELISRSKELIAFQSKVDSKEALSTMPSLSLNDIPLTIHYLESKKVYRGIVHILNTNEIAYFKMYFNINKLNTTELPYLSILKSLLSKVRTKNYQTAELNRLIKTYLGEFSCSLMTLNCKNNRKKYYFRISLSSLKENISYIPLLVNEVLNRSVFRKKEVLMIIKQLRNSLRQQIRQNGLGVATCIANSHYSKDVAFARMCYNGDQILEFYNQLLKHYHHRDLVLKLQQIMAKLFNHPNLFTSSSADEKTIKILRKETKKIQLSTQSYRANLKIKLYQKENEAIMIPSGVSYNVLSSSLKYLNQDYQGKHLVISHIVSYDYLWNEIRVKGGAYGTGLSISRNQCVTLHTYRDPNVKNSYATFYQLVDYLKKFNVDEKEFKNYIIGTIGNFELPLATPSFISATDIHYLCNHTKDDQIRLKKEVLATTIQDVHEFASVFEQLLKDSCMACVGNSEKIKEIKEQFDIIKSF